MRNRNGKRRHAGNVNTNNNSAVEGHDRGMCSRALNCSTVLLLPADAPPMAEWHLYGIAFWRGFFFFFYFSSSLFLLVPDAMALWIVRFFTIYPDPYCPKSLAARIISGDSLSVEAKL
jgi:hypothetical protein